MILRVHHRTSYTYTRPVSVCHNEARLVPVELPWQTVRSSRVDIDPPPAEYAERPDYFGNRVVYFTIRSSHSRFSITTTHDVELDTRPGPPPEAARVSWESVREVLTSGSGEQAAAREFVHESPMVPFVKDVADYGAASFAPGRPLVEATEDLMRRIHRDFEFDPHSTSLATPIADVLAQRSGVCQDFAHLAIACVRSLGLAARYVSGYIETISPPGQPRLRGSDASHAWFSVWIPEAGWLDFDATNDRIPNERYVTTAFGRDYSDVPPLKGVLFGGGAHTLEVAVDVEIAPATGA